MRSADELTDIVIIPFLEHETDHMEIPDGVLIGTAIMMYSDFDEETKEYDDSDGRISETRNMLIYAIDKYIRNLYMRNDVKKLIDYTHRDQEFLYKWFDNSKWKTMINGNYDDNDSALIITAIDVLINEDEWV